MTRRSLSKYGDGKVDSLSWVNKSRFEGLAYWPFLRASIPPVPHVHEVIAALELRPPSTVVVP